MKYSWLQNERQHSKSPEMARPRGAGVPRLPWIALGHGSVAKASVATSTLAEHTFQFLGSRLLNMPPNGRSTSTLQTTLSHPVASWHVTSAVRNCEP